MFQYHLNVELCISRAGAITYLFKYVCIESGLVSVQMVGEQSRYDVISRFQYAPYVSVSETLQRSFQSDIKDRTSSIAQLNIHLENHHTLYFHEDRQPSEYV